jgi:ATP-dependent DNA helicase UvrD/PcrA
MAETPALELEKLLNPAQLLAATTTEGPLLILAGAGSGKTRVIVHRIAYILSAGRGRAHEIFAVTFTNKAAGEMRGRLAELIGPEIDRAWIGTFHALSARMLRIEGKRLGYEKNFTIYDEDDSKRLMKSVMERAGVDTSSRGVSVQEIAQEIDRAKNLGLTPEQLSKRPAGDSVAARLARRIYPKYQDALRKANAMDFGDLLLLAVELLRHHPEARRRFHDRFRYVMVDEFQDTNAVQYELLKLLVRPENNLAVVGDDDQAIYRWRGADVTNILHFEDEFQDVEVVKLEENYRSSANILAAANSVIKRNAHRHDKTLKTKAPSGEKVKVALVDTSEQEAALVARIIAERLARNERPEDFAILYRQNAQSRLFEEALRKARIPFVLIGGTGFYDRMEVKDVLSYLRIVANPSSTQDFERVVNVPPRKIGDKTIELLRAAAEPKGLEGSRMLELSPDEMRAGGIKPAAAAALGSLALMLESFRELAAHASATEVAKRIIEETGYVHHLEKSEPQTAPDRIANVAELVSSIAEHESMLEQGGHPTEEEGLGLAGARTPLEAFLDTAALSSPNDESSRDGAVSMLTLHSAKGLEFPAVFMVGMEEQTFPSKRALDSGEREAMEEERRLCYVGMTRAKRELALIAARQRRIYGKVEVRRASRFLGELPDAIVGNLFGGIFEPRRTEREPSYAAGEGPPLRAVDRGHDRIVYDDPQDAGRAAEDWPPQPADDPAPTSDMEESRPHSWSRARAPARAEGRAFRPGSRVFHNSFGEGTVEDADGLGQDARLTIRFPAAGVKRVVARFVRSLEES